MPWRWGVSLALMQVDILFSAATIGVTTFALSALGVRLGHKLGCVFPKMGGDRRRRGAGGHRAEDSRRASVLLRGPVDFSPQVHYT